MEERNSAVLGWAIAVLVVLGTVVVNLRCSSNNVASGGSTETTNGIAVVYNSDGSRAVHAKVSFVPVSHDPQTGLGKIAAIDSTFTDDTGGYTAKGVTAGLYNILGAGAGNGELSYKDSIAVGRDSGLPNDTLKAPGALHGVVRLQPGDDSRTVFILFMGTNTFTIPRDSIGNFSAENLAEGSYHVKILSTTPNYAVLDTSLSVKSGKDSLLPDTIRLKYAGIPVPTGLTVSYATLASPAITLAHSGNDPCFAHDSMIIYLSSRDSLRQTATLSWAKPTIGVKVGGYNIYRKNADSTSFAILKGGETDMAYIDSTGVQNQTYEYRISALDSNGNEGAKSAGVTVAMSNSGHLVRGELQIWKPGSWSYSGADSVPKVVDSAQIVIDTFPVSRAASSGDSVGVRIQVEGKYLLRASIKDSDSNGAEADLVFSALEDISALRLKDSDVSGWTQTVTADSFALYTAANLATAIDGSADLYVQYGFISATSQHFSGPGTESLGPAFVMNIGTDSSAAALFEVLRQNHTTLVSLATFDTSVAYGVPVVGGIMVFGHFKNYYIELPFTGFADQTSAAAVAAQFLGVVEARIDAF